jgi:hypothetical protein
LYSPNKRKKMDVAMRATAIVLGREAEKVLAI